MLFSACLPSWCQTHRKGGKGHLIKIFDHFYYQLHYHKHKFPCKMPYNYLLSCAFQKTSICYLSFPDSYSGNVLAQTDFISAIMINSWNLSIMAQSHECMSIPGCLGDTQFSFRLRQSVGRSSSWFGQEDAYNRDAPVTLQVRNGLGFKLKVLYVRIIMFSMLPMKTWC